MPKLTQAQLELHLRTMLDGVVSGDTLEGSIEFTCADAEHWEVRGAYRIGNLQGQGGMVLLRDPSDAAPTGDIDLNKLAQGVRMLGLLPHEHPHAAVYNEALKLASAYIVGFIGREEFLRRGEGQ